MISAAMLRRYIARKFLVSILGAFTLCAVLIFMIDLVEMLRQAGKYGSVSAARLLWITLLRLPAYSEILLAFAVLVGTIGALLMLNRKSELAVMRGAGMSVWQFLRPGLTVSVLLGLFAVLVFNPMASAARTEAERLFAEAFGREFEFSAQSERRQLAAAGRTGWSLGGDDRGDLEQGHDACCDDRVSIRPQRSLRRADRRRQGQPARRVLAGRGRVGHPGRARTGAVCNLHHKHPPHPGACARRARNGHFDLGFASCPD